MGSLCTYLLIILYLLYTGQIPINSDNVMSVLSGADYLQLDEVKRLCFDFMKKELTAENCFIMLNMADFYPDDLMKTKFTNTFLTILKY